MIIIITVVNNSGRVRRYTSAGHCWTRPTYESQVAYCRSTRSSRLRLVSCHSTRSYGDTTKNLLKRSYSGRRSLPWRRRSSRSSSEKWVELSYWRRQWWRSSGHASHAYCAAMCHVLAALGANEGADVRLYSHLRVRTPSKYVGINTHVWPPCIAFSRQYHVALPQLCVVLSL